MTRWLFRAVLIGVLMAAGAGLFLIKVRAEAAADHVAELKRDIVAKREAVRLLKAELAYRSGPAMLADMVQGVPELCPLQPEQIHLSFERIAVRLDPAAPVDDWVGPSAPLMRHDRLPSGGGGFLAASVAGPDDHRLLLELRDGSP